MQLFLFTNFRLILPSSEEILMQACINFNEKRDVMSKLVTKYGYCKVRSQIDSLFLPASIVAVATVYHVAVVLFCYYLRFG